MNRCGAFDPVGRRPTKCDYKRCYRDYMREIGVRELKSRLSEVLRAVEAGEEVRVTVRGRPVAEIRPTAESRAEKRMRELVAEGRVTPPSRPLPRNVPFPPPGKGSGTAMILAEREEEREC